MTFGIQCVRCGGIDGHYSGCRNDPLRRHQEATSTPMPLTETDVRRIVLDVLERWLKAQDIDENNWMNRNQREFAAIAAVRKEMGL